VADDPTRSAAVLTPPPPLTDDGATEWFVATLAVDGPGSGRRGLRVSDHLDPDHPLVLAWPDHFTGSAEPVDCWPISLPTFEDRKRQQADQTRRASHPARKVTPVCARCGAESEQSVLVFDQPTELGRLNALAGLDPADPDSRSEAWRIERTFKAMARAHADQQRELTTAEAAFRISHQQCPDGTPELPQPPDPSADLPLFLRSTRIAGVGEITVPSIPSPNGGKS
jgi:hypothetical protein